MGLRGPARDISAVLAVCGPRFLARINVIFRFLFFVHEVMVRFLCQPHLLETTDNTLNKLSLLHMLE